MSLETQQDVSRAVGGETEAAPPQHRGDADSLASYILSQYGMSAAQIAEGVRASQRGNDPALWTALQNRVGLGQVQRAREAYLARDTAPADEPVTAPAPPPAPATAPTAAPATTAAPTRAPAVRAPTSEPRVPEERVVTHLGVRIVAKPNTHRGVIDRAREIVSQLLQHNPDAQRRFARNDVAIIIFPSNVEMTSLSEFASMEREHQTDTPDGRDWSSVRGSGGTRADGQFNVGIGEEQLVTVNPAELLPGQRPYPAGYSVGVHELAHALLNKGLTGGQRREVERLFQARRAQDATDNQPTFTDTYAASNVDEYFAQCTNAYFGLNGIAGNGNGRAWLARYDPAMLTFLDRIYTAEETSVTG
jgi:hypothetical protein